MSSIPDLKTPEIPELKTQELREWTVMVYLASDNALAPGAVAHLKALKNAGYHPEVNVLAYFDPHTLNTPVHIFDVNRLEKLKHPGEVNIGFSSNDPFVRNLVADKLWPEKIKKGIHAALIKEDINVPYDELPVPDEKLSRDDLAPRESLKSFLSFCKTYYPARHYMLFIVGHGVIVGNDLFLHDAHVGTTSHGNSRQSSLSLIDLGSILDDFNANEGEVRKLEIIGFHACSMSGVEVALQLQGKANYMLAAQGPTYSGAWSYRHILIRLFNELHTYKDFTKKEVEAAGLIDFLKIGTDPFAEFFLKRLNGNGTRELLYKHEAGKDPAEQLLQAVTQELNILLDDPVFSEAVGQIELPATQKELLAAVTASMLDEKVLKRVNRRLLLAAVPPEVASKISVKRLCKKIFDACLFNSFDFHLAGYSCDLTLCDLSQIGKLNVPVTDLVEHLRKGLKDPVVRELMVLAHWEAQSFYQEQYTDLYDYCFRLRAKCKAGAKNLSRTTNTLLEDINGACREVMKVLKRGKGEDDNGIIVRSEFCGPAYQYTHGLSVFFPWSEPVANRMWRKKYPQFAFNTTKWHYFLNEYFNATMREPEGLEENDVETPFKEKALDRELLELLQLMAQNVYNDDGQLGSVGSRDPMGSVGSRDPQGGDCDCASIKNYPALTRSAINSLMKDGKQKLNREARCNLMITNSSYVKQNRE